MAARYREIRRYPAHALSVTQIVEAMRACDMKIDDVGHASVMGSMPLNAWSFGERIDVLISPHGDDVIIDITSRCSLPTQVMDWGRNRKNVRKLYQSMDGQLPEGVTARPVTRCGHCDYVIPDESAGRCSECGQDLNTPEGRIAGDRPPRLLLPALAVAAGLTLVQTVFWMLTMGDLAAFGISAYVWVFLVVGAAGVINFSAVTFIFLAHHFAQRRAQKA